MKVSLRMVPLTDPRKFSPSKISCYTVWLSMSQSFLSAIIMTKYYHRSRNGDIHCLELMTKLSNELVIFSDIMFYYCNNYSNCYLYICESVNSRIIITVTLQAFRYCVLYMKCVGIAIASSNCSIILAIHRLIVILISWSFITCFGRHRDDLLAVCWETEECSLYVWTSVSRAMPAATYLINFIHWLRCH